MAKAMIRQKEGIVKPQVVAGREFKGTSFISKPEAIVFKVSFIQFMGSVSGISTIRTLFNLNFRIHRTSTLAFLTLKPFFSQTFHFHSILSNCYHWTTILRISSTSNTPLLVECQLVCQQRLRSRLLLN